MVDEIKTTEQLIFDAAIEVFQKKGLGGARMQEIADAAGINKSMLHYYFRSKEQLFSQVFASSFQKFIGHIVLILNNDQTTWEEKLPLIIDHYANADKKNAGLPLFIINELRNNPDQYYNILKENGVKKTLFFAQVTEAIAKGEIRPVNPMQIWMTILSGIVFPLLAQPLVKHMSNMTDEDWNNFMDTRKTMVREMLLQYLKSFKQ